MSDASGNGNTAALSGAARNPGIAGNALLFSAANDKVLAPDSASLTISGSMTLEAWIRPDELPADR